jgi:hypothetical protein
MPKTLLAELTSKLKLSPQKGESYEQFAIRATNRMNKCTEEQWKDLTEPLQLWNNEVLEAREENPPPDDDAKASGSHLVGLLPELSGFPVLEAGTENEDTGEEEDVSIEDDEANADGEEKDKDTSAEPPEGDPDPEPDEASTEEDTSGEEEPATTSRKKLGGSKPGKGKGKQVKPAKPAKAAKETKAPKPAKAAKKANGSARGLNKDHKIKIISKENPHRAGTGRFKRWPKYKEGMTVAAALKAGFSPINLRYSVADGHIKIVP